MAFIVKDKGGTFALPPEGSYAATGIDVVDLGEMMDQFAGVNKHKCRIVWVIDETMEDGRNFTVSKMYTASLHEKANLTKDLERWRGKSFTPEEREGFDVEQIIGKSCMVQVVHNEKGTYANVAAVMALPKGMSKPAIPADYVRVKNRKDTVAVGNIPPSGPITDDDVPF